MTARWWPPFPLAAYQRAEVEAKGIRVEGDGDRWGIVVHCGRRFDEPAKKGVQIMDETKKHYRADVRVDKGKLFDWNTLEVHTEAVDLPAATDIFAAWVDAENARHAENTPEGVKPVTMKITQVHAPGGPLPVILS